MTYIKQQKKVVSGKDTAKCQCGVRRNLEELSAGYAGWTERNKPCYFCSKCIPF